LLSVQVSTTLGELRLEVELDVRAGECLALAGPSGAGKTSVLRVAAGLLRPERGRVDANGETWLDTESGVDVPAERRRCGYVFQHYALFPHLSAWQNVAYALDGGRRAERRGRALELLDRFGLGSLADARPQTLSGGERQRVALARALAREPEVLLLDEPLSALDAPLRRALRDELREVLSEVGTAAVVVTHDFTEAYRLGDRIVVYDAGRVVQSAPRAELLWQPASEAVARIMGIPNVLHGTVVKAAPDRIQLRWRGQLLEAVNSPTHSYLPPPEAPIAFFIRPEYVRLVRKDRVAADMAHHMNLMQGQVVADEDFGTTWTLRIRLDAPGPPAQGDWDLEVEVPHLVYEILEIERDRHWEFSIHRGSIHVLPA
jgi:molybdate transport system ATP-binding protein